MSLMIPLYGFLEGDTLGILILAYETDTIAALAEKLMQSAKIRVARYSQVNVIYKGKILDNQLLLKQTTIQPLEKFDVRQRLT